MLKKWVRGFINAYFAFVLNITIIFSTINFIDLFMCTTDYSKNYRLFCVFSIISYKFDILVSARCNRNTNTFSSLNNILAINNSLCYDLSKYTHILSDRTMKQCIFFDTIWPIQGGKFRDGNMSGLEWVWPNPIPTCLLIYLDPNPPRSALTRPNLVW